MDAIGQLAGGVAHDFNNLLTVILAYSDIVLSKLAPEDPLSPAVKAINDAGERAASLTRQLLSFSRQMVLSPKVLDLNAVVSDTETMLRRLIGEDILLQVSLDPKIQRVMVDPGHLSQVLINLVVNARDAMPRGGSLTISTKDVDLAANATQPDLRPGKYVLLTVSDSGVGMTLEVQAHLFEPFFTTKGVGKGTGLGLAVVHGIIRQSSGHIEFESALGQGTTFRIYLPAVDASQPAILERLSDEKFRGKETVLLVEDEDSVRELARVVLESYGYQVLTARDGAQALKTAEHHHAEIDLLVTDVVMPNLGGRELAEILRTNRPHLRVLYVSGYTDDAVVRHGILQDQVSFLPKPFDRRALAAKVREVLHEKSPNS